MRAYHVSVGVRLGDRRGCTIRLTDAARRGGLRTIRYWAVDDECYMLYMYAKNEQSDLTATQLRALARVVREEFT